MARSRVQLIDNVLDNLGVLVFGQAPSDEMRARVDEHIEPTLAQKLAEGVPIYVADPGTPNPPMGGEYDDAIFLPLAAILSWAVAGPFNLGADASLKVLSDQAEEDLRRIGRAERARKFLTTDIQLRAGNRRYAQFNYTTGR